MKRYFANSLAVIVVSPLLVCLAISVIARSFGDFVQWVVADRKVTEKMLDAAEALVKLGDR